jgi:hypothetical protein
MGSFAKSLGVVMVVAAIAASCARGNQTGTAGGVGAGTPPVALPETKSDDSVSGRFADPSGWVVGATDADSGPQPATDCFVVHAADDPDLRAGIVPADVPPMPTARALAPLCRVFAPRLSQQSATEPGDETLEAFRYYAANMNDGRPFVVVAESLRSGAMGLTILDEVRTSFALRPNFVAALLPSIALDAGAQVLDFCTTPESRGCVLSTPVVPVGGGAASDEVLALLRIKAATLTGGGVEAR